MGFFVDMVRKSIVFIVYMFWSVFLFCGWYERVLKCVFCFGDDFVVFGYW